MKFELKTENDHFSKASLSIFISLLTILFIVILSSISLKLGPIARNYEINFLCRILTVEKSSSAFKKLSKLSTLNSKQKIWEMCKEIAK